jgi:long-chain acyl-CoA synthetase
VPLRYEPQLLCSDVIAYNARQFARRPAVVADGDRLTWSELEARTSQVANALLARGVGRGEKVAQLMLNSLDTFVIFWGALRAGCCVVPLNPLVRGDSLARLLNDSDTKIVFVDQDTRGHLEEVRHHLEGITADGFLAFGGRAPGWSSGEAFIDAGSTSAPDVRLLPDDTMTIMYSSGTTGEPKGIEHSQFARMMYPLGFAAGLRVDRYSVAVLATPAYASGSYINMFPAMYRGGTTVITRRFSPASFLETIERERGTHTMLVPTQWIMLVQEPTLAERDVDSLEVLVTTAQPMSPSTYEAVRAAFPHAGLYEVYGMTEGFATLRTPKDDAAGKRASVGKPFVLEDICIIDEQGRELPAGETGEICAYGMGMMKGYYKAPERTEEMIWRSPDGRTFMRSGDMGRLDEDGFLYISGRKKDMINSGGMNIYAIDIENVFMAHPEVNECAAVGLPDPRWGETPVLAVIPTAGTTIDADALRTWGNARLGGYQRVSRIVLRAELPRKTYGKISKQELREQLLLELSPGHAG